MGNAESSKKLLDKLKSLRKKKRTKAGKSTSEYTCVPQSTVNWSMKVGDLLEVIEETEQCFYVRKLVVKKQKQKARRKKGRRGSLPKRLIEPLINLEAEQWYFGNVTERLHAKQCLLTEENGNGAFLVWRCAKDLHYYLSVKSGDVARHYKINESFYLVTNKKFLTIAELVASYSKDAAGLCEQLNKPCVKPVFKDCAPVNAVKPKERIWEVERHLLQKVEKVGSGEFGEVSIGILNGKEDVAIKEFRAESADMRNEMEIMKKLDHKHLLKLYGVCTKDEPVCIITELMRNGSLYRFLRSHNKMKDIEFSDMMNFAVQISEGMTYLESKKIVHRDLRTDNVLLDDLWLCKIGDFGLAQDISLGAQKILMSTKVPLKWMAPEIFTRKEYTTKCDVWSFGVLLMEIITYGAEPYPGQDKISCIKALRQGYRMPKPTSCPQSLYNVMLLCWRADPVERPWFIELQDKLRAEIHTAASELK